MTFLHPWLLLLALLPLAWMAYEWRRTVRKVALILKGLGLLCVALALAEPVLDVSETKVAVAALVDTSSSITDNDLAYASRYLDQVQSQRGRHWLRVIPFARTTRPLAPAEMKDGWHLRRTSGDAGHATDLETAVREAVGSLPSGMVPRVLLVTDGNENRGSLSRAAWQAQQLGVPIDTVGLPGRERPSLRLEAIVFPPVAFTGERFPVDLVVSSPRRASAAVQVAAEGKPLGATSVELEPGSNQVRVQAALNSPGAIQISGKISAQGMGEVHFDQAITLRRPRLLYVSNDPVAAETNLLRTLAAAQFDVDHVNALPDGQFPDYQVIALNNWNLEAIPPARKEELEKFVREGGGLLVIGGEHNIYLENKKTEDALDRTLPAKLAPPRTPEGTCVVLIVDKSSSMEGRKMELARLAAIGVIDNLRPVDSVGVLIFDNSYQWAVPIRKAEDRQLIKRLVSGITPDGGTQIAPALTEAFKRIAPHRAVYKHIVLLTDGISEEGDSLAVSKEAALQRVTISTVGLGQDVNRPYLEKVAAFAKGKSYFLVDPSGLEQILIKDVMEHTGTTTVEKSIRAEIVRQANVLANVGMESAPALKGYVRFISKPTADVILRVDERDPLFSVWQFGLGRSAVFASDAKSRWAANWIGWNGYDKFWANVFRDLLPHSQGGEAQARFDSATGKLVVDYHLASQVDEPRTIPEIYALGPGDFRRVVAVRKVADHAWRGEIALGRQQGLFRVRPLSESRIFPEVGIYRQEEELDDYGTNEALLKQVSRFTGGTYRPAPNQVFQSNGRSQPGTLRLWPGLLAAALLLNLAELIQRKWKTVPLLLKRGAQTA